MEVVVLSKNLFVFFVIILVSFYIRKKNLVSDKLKTDLSYLLINITMPVLSLVALIQPFNRKLLNEGIKIFFITFLAYALSYIVGYIFMKIFKIEKEKEGAWLFGAMFPNQGFIGFPIVYAMFGKTGLLMASILNIPSTIMTFTVGIIIMNRNKETKFKLNLRTLFNNAIILTLLGMVLYLMNIQPPEVIMMTLNTIGNTTPAIAMVIVGLMLGEGNLKDIFSDKTVYMLSFVRLLAIPLVIGILLPMLPFNLSSVTMKVIITLCAMPVATILTIFANYYDASPRFSTNAVMLSTILCLVTLPFMFMILGL